MLILGGFGTFDLGFCLNMTFSWVKSSDSQNYVLSGCLQISLAILNKFKQRNNISFPWKPRIFLKFRRNKSHLTHLYLFKNRSKIWRWLVIFTWLCHNLLYINFKITKAIQTNIKYKINSIQFSKFISTNTPTNKLNINRAYN